MKPGIVFFFIFWVHGAWGQVERGEPPVLSGPQIRINNQALTGKVIDQKTGKGLEAATVQLYLVRGDTARVRDSLVAGMFTRPNGDFRFEGLPQADSFRLVVSGIGYAAFSRMVIRNSREGGITDLGNISIQPENQVLSNVVITAQRPALQMGIDRKIFSVERSLTATGGTALDVMRNIPSVSVDVEGNVLLRNAQPQIFVDGRPTILTLDQIQADQVERVELITNPSARFDASSSAGIINLVMKRNRRVGFNGVASAGAGYPDILNGNLTVNARQGKVNAFVSGGYNQTGGRARGKTLRQNKVSGAVDNYFNQYSTNETKRQFSSLRLGLDFFASNRSTLSATQNFVFGSFNNQEEQNQEYLNTNKILERYGLRQATGKNRFDRWNTQLNFNHRFPEQGKEFSANINYSEGDGKETANLLNSFFLPNGSLYADPARVRNDGRNNNEQFSFQADFVDPSGDDTKLEMGIRTNHNRQKSFFSSFSIRNGNEVLLPLSNNYAYSERVHAAYISYSDKVKKFGYQAGLRAEVSKFEGELIDSAKTFGYNYPRNGRRFFDALFPSLFLTQQVGEQAELQVNYTRRIRRPNFFQLNPFIDINDPVNLRQGNPQLQPEFTNSFEFNYSQDYDLGNFLAVIYYRNTIGDFTRYSDTISAALYQQLNNAAIDPNAILNTFINASSSNEVGLEFTLQHRFSDRFDITPTVDLQYQDLKAEVGDLALNNSGVNWEGQLTLNYKILTEKRSLFRDMGFQLMGEYESKEITAQGRNAAQYRVDFAMRKDFLKEKKASFTFAINDVFNTHRFGNIYDTETFYQEGFRRRNVRNFRIGLSYKFGKENFSLFRKNEERGDREEE